MRCPYKILVLLSFSTTFLCIYDVMFYFFTSYKSFAIMALLTDLDFTVYRRYILKVDLLL